MRSLADNAGSTNLKSKHLTQHGWGLLCLKPRSLPSFAVSVFYMLIPFIRQAKSYLVSEFTRLSRHNAINGSPQWGLQSRSLSQHLHEKSVLLTLPPCGVAHDGHTDAVHNRQDPKDHEVSRGEAIYHVFHFLSKCLHGVTKLVLAPGSSAGMADIWLICSEFPGS